MPVRQRPFGMTAANVLLACEGSVTLAPFGRAFALALRFPAGTAVTFNAVLEVLNALLLVFAPHIGQRVFVTAIARISAVVFASVTGHTGCFVILVKHEKIVMLKGCGLPAFCLVALPATHCQVTMKLVLRCDVARLAAFPRGRAQKRVSRYFRAGP